MELDLPPDTLLATSRLKWELGVDSFTKISLVLHFEDLYDVLVPEAEIVAALTVESLWKAVNGVSLLPEA